MFNMNMIRVSKKKLIIFMTHQLTFYQNNSL